MNTYALRGIFHEIVDLLSWSVARLYDLILYLFDLAMRLLTHVWEKYQDLEFIEKFIALTTIPAFFAVILPIADFYIFEANFSINNPIGVYLIGIVAVMIASLYFPHRFRVYVRAGINLYYLFWIIYMPLAHELTKADPHRILFGYWLNIFVPVAYIVVSALSFLKNRE
ncbi:MAG: hypothetical protein EPN93_09310 [Spirochaetes bacterium]|nr:MAG: hypothetical protein EPN93_09310 [Spirochaetota bacterium]